MINSQKKACLLRHRPKQEFQAGDQEKYVLQSKGLVLCVLAALLYAFAYLVSPFPKFPLQGFTILYDSLFGNVIYSNWVVIQALGDALMLCLAILAVNRGFFLSFIAPWIQFRAEQQ